MCLQIYIELLVSLWSILLDYFQTPAHTIQTWNTSSHIKTNDIFTIHPFSFIWPRTVSDAYFLSLFRLCGLQVYWYLDGNWRQTAFTFVPVRSLFPSRDFLGVFFIACWLDHVFYVMWLALPIGIYREQLSIGREWISADIDRRPIDRSIPSVLC